MAEARRTTRSLRGQQSAYEDQARAFQETISGCRDAYRDARAVLEPLRRQANDSTQRNSSRNSSQLSDRLLSNTLQLQAHYAVYDTAVSDWADLMETHNIAHEDSDWAESMRRQHDHFFEQAPMLDTQLKELIVIYSSLHDRVQPPADSNTPSPELGKGLQPAPTQTVDTPPPAAAPTSADGNDNVSTDTNASNGADGEPRTDLAATANPAVQTNPREDPEPGVPPMANSAMEDDPERTLTRTDSAAATIAPPAAQPKPRQRVRILEAPDEIHGFDNLSLRSEEATTDSEFYYDAAPVHSLRQHRSSAAHRQRAPTPTSYGLFAMDNGLVHHATPMAWQNFHTGNGRHHETVTYGPPPSDARARDYDFRRSGSRTPLSIASQTAASAAPAARTANSAVDNAGTALESSHVNPSPPAPRVADDSTRYNVHRDRLRHVLRDAAPPAGRGRYSADTSAPAATAPVGPAAWTTQPPASTAYIRPRSPPPPPPPVDHGVDFGRENASKFYQNATYQRSTSAKPPPLVLKELPIQKFRGDYRAFPMFRNRFLETIGGREDLEPRHKLQYLLQVLDGEPLDHANGYLITDDNYFKALEHLEDRYGDKATLVTLLTQDFVNMRNVASTSKDLRRFHDAVLRLTDEMKELGQDVNDILWRQTLVSKMPQPLRAKIYENLGSDPMTAPLSEILGRIADYARLLERSELCFNWNTNASGNSGRYGQLCRPDPRSTSHRAGTYTTDADNTHAANADHRRCPYCGRGHWPLKCDVYATIGQRLDRLRQLGYCFLCLRGGHWSGTCPKRTSEPCSYCRKNQHHQSLCRQAYPGLRRPFASLRASPVRATTTSGVPGILKKGPPGGSSSTQKGPPGGTNCMQENRDVTPVSRPGAPGATTAINPRLPSAQISSVPGKSNSKDYRRSKSKSPRTGSQGRGGTTRPTTACVDENVTQMDANACGGARLLLEHQDHLMTDRRSTPAEVRWNDHAPGDGFSGLPGIPDVSWERVPSDEETSLPESTGHCSDADTEPPAEEQWADDPSWFANPDHQDYSGYAVSTTSPADNTAVLLECLRTTAVNVNNGLTRSVTVFFDNGSNTSYISKDLARELRLPCLEKRYFRVNTFGTDATTTISGYDTSVLLQSPQGHSVALIVTASDRIVPPVTTALITNGEVDALTKNECSLVSTREKPDLLVGQDLMDLFERQYGPKLPNGFRVVWSVLGPMLGGAGKVANDRKGVLSTLTAAASDPEPPSDTTTAPPSTTEQSPPRPTPHLGYNPEDPLNLWTLDDPAPGTANSAVQETEEPRTTPDSAPGTANSAVQGFENEPDAMDHATYVNELFETDDADLFGDFSRVENAGIGTSEMTPDDQAAADMLKKIHKRHPDGRYEVPLLFRTPDGEPPSNDELPNNIPLARGRSFSTRKMLVPHPKKMLDYHSVIMDWKARGWIKTAPKSTPYTKHALSHHPVFKETSTTTATRPVYDASAKLPGRTCLNDWLYRGPIMLPEVPAILLRSRPPKIVILADISKAFLQMEVKESHKDCLRFYWFRDPFKEPTDDNLVEYRFERVPFGLKSAPYLLAGVIKLHLESVGTPLALEMLRNCYVDNVLLTTDTVTEALAKYREAKEIFAQIGMPLREFASSSAEFNAAIDPADRADLAKLKELGIRWDILSDHWDIPLMPKQAPTANSAVGQACLGASSVTREPLANSARTLEPDSGTPTGRKTGRKKKDDGRLSKRTMLRIVARIFDPQGLVQAATLLPKLAIQEAWKSEKDWDDDISGDLADLWNEAIKDFETTIIQVPRRIAKGTIKSVEIHVFTDGSSYAYGFTAYLRVRNADRTFSTNLVYARARVKPIKDAEKFTIPRMELLGVLLGARVAAFLHKELLLPVTATYLWSDSTIVLHQVANDEAIKEVWTENRLKEIRRLRDTLKIQFRYVPTDDNPADIVSRGLPAIELQKCEKWWFGAPFLALETSRWPEQPSTLRTRPSPSDQPTELYGTTAFTTLYLELSSRRPRAQWIRQRSQRKKQNPLDAITEPLPPTSSTTLAVAAVAGAANSAAQPPRLPSEPILPREMEEKYDRWPRLVRIQYYVVRFAAACLRHLRQHLDSRKKQRRHAPALGFDLGQCFTTLGRKPTIRDFQLITMIILRKTQLRHPPSTTDRRNLGIFESQGLLYVKGRLGNMKLRPTALTPLYLPREARDAELIILEYHRINGHAGVTVTLANLRLRYWFTKGRSTVRSVLRRYCFACRRESMHPFAVPPWPQLPTSRVTNARPFFFTGLDFFGPLYLRAPNGSGAYYVSKHYVCIFVCMTLRCIHLELCEDLSTDAFLHAFKRFGFRREFPHRILSDNGLSFITAREVINRISGRGRPAHQQPVKRTLPVRKAVSARLAARRMPAPAAFSATARTQQQRPANSAGRMQQRGTANSAVPSAVLTPYNNRSTPTDAMLTRDEEKLVDFCQRHNIEWQTITELSPWKGGVYERLIGLVKHCLRRSIGNTKPTVVEFLSLLTCAEHTANCRPLAYVADSDTDFFLVRPQDFIIPMLDQEAHQYPLDPQEDDSSPDDPDFIGPGENKLHAKLMKDLTKGRRLADAFWQSFRDGTLLELRNRGIDSKRRQFGETTIQPGDLVLVSETDVPRSEWRMALALELLPHSDGLVRSARIRYAKTKRETNRALEHLYPIGKIPVPTTACSISAVSRLGIYLSVMLSDIVSMSDNTTNANENLDTAAHSSSVPISSATFDASGELVLADLPSLAAPKPTQETAAMANSAMRSATGLGPSRSDVTQDQSAPPLDPGPAHALLQQLDAADARAATIETLLEKLQEHEDQATNGLPTQSDLVNLAQEVEDLLDASLDSQIAATGPPGTANSAVQERTEPLATPTANLPSLPAIRTPRPLLFDPLTIQMEHARQQLVALDEKMRLWNVGMAQLRRCLDRMEQGLPADQSLTRLQTFMARSLYPDPPRPAPAAPRADPRADQGTQTDDAASQPEDQNDQAEDPNAANDPEASADADHQADQDEHDAFWDNIPATGEHDQDDNPFLQEVQPPSESFPASRSPPPSTSSGTALGARPAAEARRATKSSGETKDAATANSAVPTSAVASGSGTANSAVPSPALRGPANQAPFNGRALLRARPALLDMPSYPLLEEIERRTRQFFALLPEGEVPPILEPIDESTLYSRPADRPPQTLPFVMNRSSLMPIPTTWDPLLPCNGDGEQECFHRCIRRLRIIQATRWITGRLKKDEQLKADMHALLERFVPSFGHMILLSYAVRLFNKHSNVHATVDFLTRMLDCSDFEEDMPRLLARYQPLRNAYAILQFG